MTLPPRWTLARSLLVAAAVVVASLAHPAPAQAQGRCACNRGCHQYPGQCVQPNGGGGCDPGFAPFCGTRATSCPNMGWVSCDGACTCVRVYGSDAGAPDATPGTPDAAPADLGGADAPAALVDAPARDVAPSADGSARVDSGPVVTGDAGCVCPAGACIDGACVTERCRYFPELGFKCAAPRTTCRLIDGEAYCVPLCAAVSCAAGEFCDESSSGLCVRDECATMTCPTGTSCRRNQCGNDDGGVARDAAGPADTGGADASGAGMTAGGDGCGCRAAGPTRAAAAAWWGVAALMMVIRRRRRR